MPSLAIHSLCGAREDTTQVALGNGAFLPVSFRIHSRAERSSLFIASGKSKFVWSVPFLAVQPRSLVEVAFSLT